MAPGVLVTAAPAGWASASGVFSVMTAPDTETMRSVSAGDPTVTVSPAANVSGLRAVPGCTEMVVAPAATAAASVLDPGVRRYVLASVKASDITGAGPVYDSTSR